MVLEGLLGERDASDFEEKKSNRERAYNREESVGERERREKESPPHHRFPKVVGVARVCPKSLGHKFTFVFWVAEKVFELSIGNGFEEKSR